MVNFVITGAWDSPVTRNRQALECSGGRSAQRFARHPTRSTTGSWSGIACTPVPQADACGVSRFPIRHGCASSAEADFAACTLLDTTGLTLPDSPPMLHSSKRQRHDLEPAGSCFA